MHEDLLNAVSNLVHRHVLVTLHAMTGTMLARLDGNGADLATRTSAPRPPAKETGAEPTLATVTPAIKASTLERKARLHRAKQRKAAIAAATPPIVDPWPELRAEFLAQIERRSLSRDQVGAELKISKASVVNWLSPRAARHAAERRQSLRNPPVVNPGET